MRGEAIVAAVDLRDGESDAFARRRRERSLRQGAPKRDIALEGRGIAADEAKEIGYDAKLLPHGLEQRPRGGRRGVDVGGRGNAGHEMRSSGGRDARKVSTSIMQEKPL